jgi:hypothetical protein
MRTSLLERCERSEPGELPRKLARWTALSARRAAGATTAIIASDPSIPCRPPPAASPGRPIQTAPPRESSQGKESDLQGLPYRFVAGRGCPVKTRRTKSKCGAFKPQTDMMAASTVWQTRSASISFGARRRPSTRRISHVRRVTSESSRSCQPSAPFLC